MTQLMTDFQTYLWPAFTAQHHEPDDSALRYAGAGRRPRTSCATSGETIEEETSYG
jgi:hypothetical protein